VFGNTMRIQKQEAMGGALRRVPCCRRSWGAAAAGEFGSPAICAVPGRPERLGNRPAPRSVTVQCRPAVTSAMSSLYEV